MIYRYGGEAPLAWAELVGVVTVIEQRSRGRIVSLDVRSRGSKEQREIAAVEIIAGAPATVRPQPGRTFAGRGRAGRAAEDRARSLATPSVRLRRSPSRPAPAPGRPSLASVPALRGTPPIHSHPSALINRTNHHRQQ